MKRTPGLLPFVVATGGEVATTHAAMTKAALDLLRAMAPKELVKAAQEIRRQREAERRGVRLERLAAAATTNTPLSLLGHRYPVILIDPPRSFGRKISNSRDTENFYGTMSHAELCALPVKDVATDTAILFLWTTSAHLEETFEQLEAWGFKYKTHAAWVKESAPGMGHYFRQQHELLVVATRGNMPTPPTAARVSSIFTAPRGAHSEKPQCVYEIIEKMYPELPKVELFARRRRSGWDAWGNQVGILDSVDEPHSTACVEAQTMGNPALAGAGLTLQQTEVLVARSDLGHDAG